MRHLQVGERIDKYEILGWVEYSTGKADFKSHLEGGLGVVYRAYDLEIGDDVVLKTYKGPVSRTSRQAQLFREEAETWVRLGQHPHVVRAFNVFEHDARYYVAIELVPGGSIRSRIGHLDVKQAVQIALGICRGMIHASETLHMVHRDLKPENVLLTSEGVAKVTDFGLARIFDEEHLTRPGAAGTLGYMAPEQRVDARNVDARADIYAFGIILYEMLTATHPAASSFQLPEGYRDEWSSALASILERSLRAEARERFPTFRSVEEQLVPVASALGVEELEVIDPRDSDVIHDVMLSIPNIELRMRGDNFLRLGEFEEAIACYTELLQSKPDRAYILSRRGQAYLAMGCSVEAEADFERALALDPEDTSALLGKAGLHAKRGDRERALRHYDAAIESDPRCWEMATHNKAVLLEQAGDLAASLKCYDDLLKRERTAELLVSKAQVLQATGQASEALALCEEALQTEPDSMRALGVKAHLHDHLGQLDSAIAAFLRLLHEDPDSDRPWLLNRLGICYGMLGNRSAALQYHEKAHRLAPDDADYFWNYAADVERLRGWSEAIKLYTDHVAANPDSGESWYRLGKAYAEVGDFEQAREALKRCLQLAEHAYARGLLRHLGEA